MAITERILGSEHPDVADTLHNLALYHSSQGHYPEAESLFRKAPGHREKTYGSEHPDVAQSLDQLGVLYGRQGQFKEALPFFERALDINEKGSGLSITNWP